MIKRSGAFLLILLYLVTVTGFALNLHYCFNNIYSVSVDAPAKSCKPVASKMKCCKDKRFEVKVKDAHQTESNTLLSQTFNLHLLVLPFADLLFSAKQRFLANSLYEDLPDPPLNTISTFLRNRKLRI